MQYMNIKAKEAGKISKNTSVKCNRAQVLGYTSQWILNVVLYKYEIKHSICRFWKLKIVKVS